MDNEQMTFEFEPRPTIKGFPELRWTGKRPYTATQYFPAQLRESYGEEQGGWLNKIFWGDNLQVMSHLLRDFRGQIDLIYIDPPFDSKADYKKKIEVRGIGKAESDSSSFEEKQYGDIWTNDEYLQFMYERLLVMRELLSDRGSIYVHVDHHKAHHIRLLMDEVFGVSHFQNDIIWRYSGWNRKNNTYFNRRHDTILYYSKTDAPYFEPFTLEWESPEAYAKARKQKILIDEETGKKYVLSDAGGGKRVKRFLEEAMKDGRPIDDVWIMDKINNSDKEGLDYPTQKPERLLERIIISSCPPEGIVFDCFMGSGTTQAVAMKLGRRFIGADINLGAIQTTTKRLLSVAASLQSEEVEKRSTVRYDQISRPPLSMVAEESAHYYAAASAGKDKALSSEDRGKVIDFLKSKGIQNPNVPEATEPEDIKYTGFEVYNVNNYDFFRNPVEARDLLIAALEIQPFPASDVWDGELDSRMVKIMPVNRIATKADLKELLANLPYKTYEKRKEENPNQPVERITIVCMGHEPDLKGALEQELHDYKVDIQIVDILRDKADIQLKRDAEAEIVREGGKLVIRAFYPMNLMQKLSLQKEFVEDWRQLVDSIMIDWNYDGVVMQPAVMDVPGKNEIVSGVYDIPEGAGTIKVKITDLLSESLEVEVR